MPLEHMDVPGIVDPSTLSHIRFPMKDSATGKTVPCRISDETLQDNFGTPQSPVMDIFNDNRGWIETVAGEKYDAVGAKDGIVDLTSLDFNGD